MARFFSASGPTKQTGDNEKVIERVLMRKTALNVMILKGLV